MGFSKMKSDGVKLPTESDVKRLADLVSEIIAGAGPGANFEIVLGEIRARALAEGLIDPHTPNRPAELFGPFFGPKH